MTQAMTIIGNPQTPSRTFRSSILPYFIQTLNHLHQTLIQSNSPSSCHHQAHLNSINSSTNSINSILSHAASIFSRDIDERSLIFTIHSASPFNLDKDRPLPASKTAIESLPTVTVTEMEYDECAICLTEYGGGCEGNEMLCKHRFHEGCINKWLNVNGTCLVCHYEMPLDDEEESGGGGVGWQVMVSVRRAYESVRFRVRFPEC